MERVGDLGGGDGHAQGHAVVHALGHGHHVGLYAPMFNGEHFLSRASETGLHFVADKDSSVLADDVYGDREVLGGRHHKTAHAQNGLGQKACNIARGGGLDQFFDVRGTGYLAGWIGQLEGAAIAIGRVGVLDASHLGRDRHNRQGRVEGGHMAEAIELCLDG